MIPSDGNKPELATNRPGEETADAVSRFLSYAAELPGNPRVDIATGYFNLGGYTLLADALDEVGQVRLLLGAEPQPDFGESRVRAVGKEPPNPRRSEQLLIERALEGQDRTLAAGRNLLGFSREVDNDFHRLIGWLSSGRVQVRRFERSFLHGKAFIVGDNRHGLLAGSSNFTRAGLTTNLELNLGNYQPTVVERVQDWFDELWDQSSEYDLAALFVKRFDPHPPNLVFLRMLWEIYGQELQQIETGLDGAGINLTQFQTDGLFRAKSILRKRGGVLIADEVGLGKTFLAGKLIEEATIERRQRVLVVAPAALRDGTWDAFRNEFNVHFQIVSYEELARDNRLNPEAPPGSGPFAGIDPDEFALVVIDEAHRLRNPSTLRSQTVRRLLTGKSPKQLVLLTATPVNNSLWDLYHMLGLFLPHDASLADAGILSLRDRFATAMRLDPDDLTPEHLFDLLDAVAVRRTRKFIKRYYENATIKLGRGGGGEEVRVVFPTPRVKKISYNLAATLNEGFFERFEAALSPEANLEDHTRERKHGRDRKKGLKSLTFARYLSGRYLLPEFRESDDRERQYQVLNAGILKSGLLKRFESSPAAFVRTCRRMISNHDAFLDLLARGQVATAEALAEWSATDFEDEGFEYFLSENRVNLEPAERYDSERLADDLRSDRALLAALADEIESITQDRDPNLKVLVAQLIDIAAEAKLQGVGPQDQRDKRKVIIFSYFADTVEWIADHLSRVTRSDPRLAVYRDRIVAVTGDRGNARAATFGFAPKTNWRSDREEDDIYDLLICTDVLAEGVNLQQARHIVNYDLPWNPMRLVQRHGRIDRLGSNHAEVFIHCVFPDEQLDELLGLEDRIRAKLRQAANSLGTPTVLPGEKGGPGYVTDTRGEIERLRRSDPTLFETGGTKRSALSGEEFRRDLWEAMQDPTLAELIKDLPWGSGSGMVSAAESVDPGSVAFVFCARIGDIDRPEFRFVEFSRRNPSLSNSADRVNSDGTAPRVSGELLICLDRAQPPRGSREPRMLSEEDYDRAFDAWKLAKDDILEVRRRAADPATYQQPLEKALRDAAELIRNHHPPELSQEEADKIIESIEAPYPHRTVTQFRSAIRKSEGPAEKVAAVLDVVRQLGLKPYEPPEPLPTIEESDVNLICWMAISSL